ncbi:MAG: glycosyltransferase family 4 protein [Nanoarchaeota archaeon]
MRIAKICAHFWPVKGGMENHMYYESKEFIKRGHSASILVSDSTHEGRLKTRTEVFEGINIRRFPTWFKYSYFSPFFPGLFLHLMKEKYDILHIHSYRQFYNLAIFIARLRGIPVVLSTHWPEYPDSVRNKNLNRAIRFFDSTLGPLLLRSADRLIVQTLAEQQWFEKKFKINAKKIIILPPGIHKSYIEPRDGKTFRAKHKINEKNIVLCLGRIHRSKGFDKIIKIAKGFSDTRFVFVGPDGGYRKEFENLARELQVEDKVLFTGEVSEQEKIDALAACDVLAMPSDYEAFGISLIEAFAQGKPVIASNSGGMPHVVGDCGFVFEKNNLAELEQKLKLLLSDKKLREKFGRSALELAKNYAWDEIAGRLEKEYEKLIAEKIK